MIWTLRFVDNQFILKDLSLVKYFYQNEDDLSGGANLSHLSDSEKRAHHNALERKRRDHIKDSFNGLKDAIPTLQVLLTIISMNLEDR